MEIGQVKFGNYTIGNPNQRANQGNKEPEEKKEPQVQGAEVKSVNRDDLLNAMNMVGMQNMSQISPKSPDEINPQEFLDEGRIGDIEAMMMEFESGVNRVAEAIGNEFPELSEETRNALAARIFAQA